MTQTKQVVVIGAGFAGLMAAKRLAWKTRRSQVAITLVNGTDYFIERLRLHQLAANQDIARRSLTSILRGTGLTFVQGWVTAIHPAQHSVEVKTDAGTRQIDYDYLIYALGSTIDRDSVRGVSEHAYVLTPFGQRSAAALRDVLPKLNESGGKVLIGGGGPTGIEAAAEFASAFPSLKIHLVTRGQFGAFIRRDIADYMLASLQRRGVTVQDHTTIADVRAREARTSDGTAIPFDVCLWTGGFKALLLAREAGLAVNELGQILTDPYLRSISHPDIFAVGDAAWPVEEPGVPMRMSAFTALATGVHAADCLSRVVRGKSPRPLSFVYYGQAIALGRNDAIGFPIFPADKATPPYFVGRFGFLYREFFVNLAISFPRIERWPGIFNLQGKGRYAAAKRKAARQAQIRQSA